MQGGLEPSEADPRFHQQMVYAVATTVLENFDRALGRRIKFRGGPLRVFPHAFQDANAFFDPRLQALCFGYFQASKENPGANLPGQTVFTCLSHDVIAHEVTHAIVHRLREHFLDATNADVLAFHEGFSDIVAIFQHFTFQDVLRDAIRKTRGNLRSRSELIDLATQFGHATAKQGALRSALEPHRPDPTRLERVTEPHERGSILVAAVFDAFFDAYQEGISDLIRIATGGTGVLPEGDIHPDLVDRLAREAARAAQGVLTMCIRAFDYLPPVDVTFGDFLRALVTADTELVSRDRWGQRAAVIDAFRERGIFPQHVTSLAEGERATQAGGGGAASVRAPAGRGGGARAGRVAGARDRSARLPRGVPRRAGRAAADRAGGAICPASGTRYRRRTGRVRWSAAARRCDGDRLG
jgi:hypothetical protein